ncbi:MAG: hypothetical protein DKT66_06960 [Candidatus Melainabacteria bacterium]|nr:MAG: hypothetical protein DKT66_06960 [Candidatus Melainabacteria bacterium]
MAELEKKYCPSCYRQFDDDIVKCPHDRAELRGRHNDPLIGNLFAERYLIESVLGLGGMSIVYKAQHSLMNRTVAIKMLHQKLKDDSMALERFRLEAQAASSLNHQNVITVYDFGISPTGEPFFVMDCLSGESLEKIIDRDGRIEFRRAINIFKQVCDGLEEAHKKGIVHRDLKPANVILMRRDDGGDLVKLVDFGIAKLLPQAGKVQQQLTRTGEVFGSPIYMSPEQCLGRELDTRSDIYALGCLMYEAVAGEPPFIGDSFLETMNMHVDNHPKLISEKAPDSEVPAELEAAILCCLQKDPDIRFQTAGELKEVLSSVASAVGSASGGTASRSDTHPYGKGKQKRAPVEMIVVSMVASILLVMVAFVALWPGAADDRGAPLDKLLWSIYLSEAEDDVKKGKYESAESNFAKAEERCKRIGDRNQRLQTTLRSKTVLYEKWEGHAEDLEKVNNQIAAIDTERVKQEYFELMKLMDTFESKDHSAVSQSSKMLKAEAEIPKFVSVSSKLYSKGLWLEQEQLLKRCLAIERKLVGDDNLIIAKLETRLAECFVAQRKFLQVRQLLSHALSVFEKHGGDDPNSAVAALNKLGQFDLDRNDFKRAEPELARALERARKLSKKDNVLLLCLRSYADLLQLTNRVPAGDELDREADLLEKKIPVAVP